MKKLLILLFLSLLATELVSARVFYYADEADYRNNVNYALYHPFDGVDPDVVGDFDKYSCVSLGDHNGFAGADQYDAYEPLSAKTATRKDLQKLRREDQLRIINEDPYDSLDENDIEDYDDWNCYTLRDYNSFAGQDGFDNRRVIDFTHFDDIYEVQKIGKYRYNNFYAFPEDFTHFNLQHTVRQPPYYEPYDYRRSPYPLYGYGARRIEDW
jgi:hypothetical protein